MPTRIWQSRPIEDSLRAKCERYEKVLRNIANWKIACHEEDGTTSYVIGGETSIIARTALESEEK
jgi:hypothetical protein